MRHLRLVDRNSERCSPLLLRGLNPQRKSEWRLLFDERQRISETSAYGDVESEFIKMIQKKRLSRSISLDRHDEE